MGLFVFGTKVFERYVGIFLCGCKARVSEKLLDGAQIRTALQQMGREAMTQRVCGQTPAGGEKQARLFDQTLNIASIQATAPNTDEYRSLTLILRLTAAQTISLRKISSSCP